MAIKDVRDYFFTMLAQYLEEKQNLEDFSEALKSGYITEEQMQEAQETVASLEENYHRLAYIMYLLEMPNRKDKKIRYTNQNKVLLETFKKLGADEDSIVNENIESLKHFKATLRELAKENKE
jgi:anion-transporting  ArsA/GET3 family ATPase